MDASHILVLDVNARRPEQASFFRNGWFERREKDTLPHNRLPRPLPQRPRTVLGRVGAAGGDVAICWQKPPMPLTVAMHCSYEVKKQCVSPSLA
jgi:hypothetical protein